MKVVLTDSLSGKQRNFEVHWRYDWQNYKALSSKETKHLAEAKFDDGKFKLQDLTTVIVREISSVPGVTFSETMRGVVRYHTDKADRDKARKFALGEYLKFYFKDDVEARKAFWKAYINRDKDAEKQTNRKTEEAKEA